MQIARDSWHAQLYVRTYLDAPVSQEIGAEEDRAALRARFEQGRLSLCPYFWSVVAAAFLWTPLAAFEKACAAVDGFAQKFGDRLEASLDAWAARNGPSLRAAALAAFAATGLWLTTTFVSHLEQTLVREERDVLAAALRLQERGSERARSARYEERHQAWLRTAEGQAWLKEEAVYEAAERDVRAVREAEWARQREESRLTQRQADAEAQAWLNSREHRIDVARGIAATAASDAGMWQRYAERETADYQAFIAWSKVAILACLAWLALRLLQTAFAGRLRAMGRGIAASAASIARFSSDTWSLLAQFARAKKEKVCPSIQFVDNAPQA